MILDIKHTDTGDLDFSSEVIAYAESTSQHQRDLIMAQKGHYKLAPNTGVGAINYVNDENPENFLRSVRKEFTRDGMKVRKVAMQGGSLIIDAEYR